MSPHLQTARELHSRVNDGIEVRLLWAAEEERLLVHVADSKTDDSFVIEVREGERAMDVFHHPYAYAAWRGIRVGGRGERPGSPAVPTA
jgi:hypothetical protein